MKRNSFFFFKKATELLKGKNGSKTKIKTLLLHSQKNKQQMSFSKRSLKKIVPYHVTRVQGTFLSVLSFHFQKPIHLVVWGVK